MKIELAINSGFCIGVRDAILKIVKEIYATDEIIYVYGPLIHNPQTIEVLSKRGLQTIDTFDDIDNKIIAIRTHGIRFDELKEIKSRAKGYINLTCSRVARVQELIKKYSHNGFFIIIIGDKDHAEIVGLKSYASSEVVVVSKVEDVKNIPVSKKYLVVSQTTLDTELFDDVVSEINIRFSNVVVINTICNSTHKRQGDVKEAIQKGIDALVVVGGKNSANTQRLAQIGSDRGIITFHIETESELDKKKFVNMKHVLVTAGASTPGWIINRVLEKLYDIKYENSNIFINLIKRLSEFIVRTNLFSAVTAFFITLFAQRYSDGAIDYLLSTISFLYIFSMYTINSFFELNSLKIRNPYKYSIYKRFKNILIPLSLFSIIISFIITFRYGYITMLVFAIISILGSIYSTECIRNYFYNMNNSMIKKLYCSKSIIVTSGWVLITTVVPLLILNTDIYRIIIISIFIYTLIFLRDILLDFIAFQGDLILGRETLPIIMGINKTRTLLFLFAILTILIFVCYSLLIGKFYYLIFTISIIYFIILLTRIVKPDHLVSLKYELLVDLGLLVFIVLYLWISL